MAMLQILPPPPPFFSGERATADATPNPTRVSHVMSHAENTAELQKGTLLHSFVRLFDQYI